MQTKSKLLDIEIISTEELFNILGESNSQIIDIRPVEAYNGWKIKKEERGGHDRQ